MRSIFISYRRDDAEGQAGRLYEGLAEAFGESRVFMDVTDIRAGRDFRREIEQRVASCAALVVVIGRSWLEARDAAGQRRLDNPADFVRLEVASALARSDVTVVPVLVSGARMPEAKDLPDDLKDLVFRNAVPLSHQRWDSDLEVLVRDIEELLNTLGETEIRLKAPPRSRRQRRDRHDGLPPTWRKLVIGLTAVTVLGLAGVGYTLYEQQQAEQRFEEAQRQAREETARAAQAAAQAQAREAKASEEAAAAAASAAAAMQAASEAQERADAAARASAEEKARLEQEAAALRDQQARAVQEAQAKASEAERVQRESLAALRAADDQARTRQDAAARLARNAPAGGPRSAGSLEVPGWPLRTGCAGTELVVSGTATFGVRPQPGGGVMVTQRYRGGGGGYSVELSADTPFGKPASAYTVTAVGVWKGPRPVTSSWTVRIETSDGFNVRSAKGAGFQSSC